MTFRRARGARSGSLLLAVAATSVALSGHARGGVAAATGAGVPATRNAGVARAPATLPENPVEALVAADEAELERARTRPEGVVPLLRMMEHADAVAPDRFDGLLSELASGGAGRSVDPLVFAYARLWAARRLDARGDAAGADKLRAELGFLTRFWVVGPFGDGRAAYGVTFPPEQEGGVPDVTRKYPGKEREVGWRKAEGAMRRGALHLDALLRPARQGAAYLVAFVRSDRAQVAALRLGSPGPLKVWCNGRLVLATDVGRSANLDQDAVGVPLAAGWNRLLIKTVVTDAAWRVFARLTATDGAPIPFVNDWQPGTGAGGAVGAIAATGPAPTAKGRRAAGSATAPVRTLEGTLRAAAVKAGGGADAAARAWLDLGTFLRFVDSHDQEERAAASAFEASLKRKPSVEALLELARVGRDDDERRRALERALTLVEGDDATDAATGLRRARVLTPLGDLARDQRRDAVALARWRAALVASPGWWPASLSLAEAELDTGLAAGALGRLQALPAAVRRVARVRRMEARLDTALGRRQDAVLLWEALAADDREDLEALGELSSAAEARGDHKTALGYFERAALLRPDAAGLALDWARAREGAGDVAGAREVLEATAARLPDEPTVATALGHLLDRAGQPAEAEVWMRTAVRLRPQDPALRRYADALARRASAAASGRNVPGAGIEGADGERDRDREQLASDLARRYAADVDAVLKKEDARQHAAATADEAEPDPAVVLLDRRVVRVHGNGLSETFAQRMVAIRTDRGAEDNQDFYVRYSPGVEEVEILEARVFRRGPTGAREVRQATSRDDQDLSEPWYGLYYDYRAEVIRFEGLRAGDVLEVRYLVADTSRENQMGSYFGDLQLVAEGVPKRAWDYTLIGPKTRAFHFAAPKFDSGNDNDEDSRAGGGRPKLEQKVTDEGDERVYRFAAEDVPRIEPEPAMPGLSEVAPYLHVSTYATWADVGTWYWGLVAEQLTPDDAVRRAARSVLKPGMKELDKIRALYDLVVEGTRYVGLEFGIHGFRPYKVSQVLSRRFGDCKDKAALMVALLGEAGIDAEMTLLRTKRNGRVDTAPASLAVFDHAIAYVPKYNLYLDGTAEFTGLDELPNQDQGVMVLRVSARGATLATTPVLPSSRNVAARRWDVRLSANGQGDVNETLTVAGQAASEWREHYQSPGERLERYGKVWTGHHPGTRLVSVDMPGIGNRHQPVTVRAHAIVPELAAATPDGGLMLSLGGRDSDLVRSYARLSSRRLVLELAYPWRHDETIAYRLPRGMTAPALPSPRKVEGPFGRFELRVDRDGGEGIRVHTALDVRQARIEVADYPAFRRFLSEVDAIMSERILLRAGGPRAGGEPERTAAR